MLSPEDVVDAGDPSSEYSVEFRNYDDDAWYSARVILERDEALRIKFLDFGDDHDGLFDAKCFKSLTELEEFNKRFRPVSRQVQDNECLSIVRGMTVCACHWYSNEDVRFYDAVVLAVQEKEHSFREGEEVCLCTFSLLWLHGAAAGTCTNNAIADICKIQTTSELDPVVTSFLKMARDRTEVTSNSSSYSKGGAGWDMVPLCAGSQNTKHKPGFFERLHKETRCARRSVAKVKSPSEKGIVKLVGRRLEDRDLGGMKNWCMILIGNLDKSLSPPIIEEFLQRQTSILPKVYIFPSLSSELFTKGAIICDYERGFQELCKFLSDPNHIIISTARRPWVIIEKLVGLKNIKASIGTMTSINKEMLRKRSRGKSNDLRIVNCGTREYEIASVLRGLFMQFSAHQGQLHKWLAFEEGKILSATPCDVVAAEHALQCTYD